MVETWRPAAYFRLLLWYKYWQWRIYKLCEAKKLFFIGSIFLWKGVGSNTISIFWICHCLYFAYVFKIIVASWKSWFCWCWCAGQNWTVYKCFDKRERAHSDKQGWIIEGMCVLYILTVNRINLLQVFFCKIFTHEDYNALISGWTKKLKRCSIGYQKWGLFYAKKAV